ncbi:hypothetical protein, partial [Methylobacterium sp. WL6]|uniref:hypothetical protein n=1 Tax=Methylobacterium sp. WL6 TaxID=2603901 RepID=UPI0016508B38
SPNTAPGTYTIEAAFVFDKAGNSQSYYGTQLADIGAQTSFTVVGSQNADTTAPVLTGLTLPGTVDLSHGAQTIAITAGASDAGSGVSYVQ